MSTTLRPLVFAFAVSALLAPAALAGGIQATIEGPAKDGAYVVRTYHCRHPMSLEVSAFAEGIVKGERQSLPLELERTSDDGVLTFRRTWPNEGRWLVRLDMG